MKPSNAHFYEEKLWEEALVIIKAAPQSTLGLEFEEKIFILFSLLGVAISDQTICIAYHSALSEEDLEWLKSRLDHALSKAS